MQRQGRELRAGRGPAQPLPLLTAAPVFTPQQVILSEEPPGLLASLRTGGCTRVHAEGRVFFSPM